METKQCSANVYPKEVWGSFHPHTCHRKGIVERDGKWYCKIHDPIYRQAKNDAALAKFNAQYDEAKKRNQLEAAAPAMYEALKLAIPALVKHNLDDSCTEALSTIYAVLKQVAEGNK